MKKGNVYRRHLHITNLFVARKTILRYLEVGRKFSVMAAVLAIRYPVKAPELLAYNTSIVKLKGNLTIIDDGLLRSCCRC